MELLLKPEDRGYPVEYLLSRIRGRRARLIKDWGRLMRETEPLDRISSAGPGGAKAPEGSWTGLLREYRWVYFQMDAELRGIFESFFLYSELRTLFICLRHVKKGTTGEVNQLLDISLLSEKLKKVLATSEDLGSAAAGVERMFLTLSADFAGLETIVEKEGLRGIEQRLVNLYLAHTVSSKLHPLMREFFTRLIDSRNIMTLYKHLRSDEKSAPLFISGGTIAMSRCRNILGSGDMIAFNALVNESAGIKTAQPDPAQVENALYRGTTRSLRKAGREPFGPGPILDYLWRCSIEALNLSVLFFGRGLERDELMAELVQ